MSQPDILIIEDRPTTAGILAAPLIRAGYRVTMKHALADALHWLNTPGNRPELILCAARLSSQGGHAFIRQARPDPATLCPLVMLLAAEEDIHDKIAAFEAGADDYVVEPLNPIELGLRVRALLARVPAPPCAPTTLPGHGVAWTC